MQNILQVTTPVNDGNRNVINTHEPKSAADNNQVQNAVDPTRVVRADGQQGAKTGDAMGEGTFAVIDSGSNYGAFVKHLTESSELPKLLEQLFQAEDAAVLFPDSARAASLLEQLYASIQADTPQELLSYLKGQEELQAKFSGPFFDGLRRLLAENSSDSAKEAVLAFMRGYNSYISGSHMLTQMKNMTGDIKHLMLKQFHGQYENILDEMDWDALNGDTEGNTAVLNQKLIPFLASYIARTHDFGAVRNAVMLLVFHAVKYENGSEDQLAKLFENLMHTRGFDQVFEEETKLLEQDLQAFDKELTAQGMDPELVGKDLPDAGNKGKLLHGSDIDGEMRLLDQDKDAGETRRFQSELQGFRGNIPREVGQAASLLNSEGNPVRSAALLLLQHIAKFENGGKEQLQQLYDKLAQPGVYEELQENGILQEKLDEAFSALSRLGGGGRNVFADVFSRLVEKGANGEAGLENIQQFYNIMNGMLVNESVYLPLIHLLVPFRYQDQQVVSEMWINPDAEGESVTGNRRIKMLLKFDIRDLGRFDLLLALENRQVGIQLYVPKQLRERAETIGRDVSRIFRKNGLTVGQMLVREKRGEIKVPDVFPEIREKERTINVRI